MSDNTKDRVKIVPKFDHFDQKGLVNRLGRCAVCCEVVDFNKRVRTADGKYFMCKSCAEMTVRIQEIAHV